MTWWVELLRDGWLGGAVAVWIAATVVPLVLLAVLSVLEQARLALRRAAITGVVTDRPRRRVPTAAEDSA